MTPPNMKIISGMENGKESCFSIRMPYKTIKAETRHQCVIRSGAYAFDCPQARSFA